MLTTMDEYRLATSRWEHMYREYAVAAQLPDRAEAYWRREEIRRRAHRLIARAHRQEDWWVIQALRDPQRTEFVLEALAGNVPRRFFHALVQAAVALPDRARIPRLVLPCVYSYGPRRVTETLLPYLERGTAAVQAGAAVALCSTGIRGVFDWGWYCQSGEVLDRTLLKPTPQAQAAYAAWRPARDLRNQLLVKAFVSHDDAAVRYPIVALLYSDPEVSADLRTALGPAGLAYARRTTLPPARLRAQLIVAMVEVRWCRTMTAPFSTLHVSFNVAVACCVLTRVGH
jgi:hypothetical protein